MSTVANSMSSSMSSELKTMIDGLKSNMQTVGSNSFSTANLESDIRTALSGISDDMARALSTAANDYTNAVSDAQKSASSFLERFGASTSTGDFAADQERVKFAEESLRPARLDKYAQVRREAGLM